jgi:hypothetical protein
VTIGGAARFLLLSFLLPCSALPQAAAAAGDAIEYLYLEPNTDGSSGGHVAIRFGDLVYHFQHQEEGTLRAAREPFGDFAYAYGTLGNRPMHCRRIGVSAETYDVLQAAFDTRWVREQGQVAVLDGIRRDRALLESLATTPGDDALPAALPAAGYFLDGAPAGDDGARPPVATARPPGRGAGARPPVAAALARVGARVAAAYGAEFVDRRIAATRRAIVRLRPRRYRSTSELVSEWTPVPPYYGLADRYRDLLLRLTALEVLRERLRLRPDAVVRLDGGDFILDGAAAGGLAAFAGQLEDEIVRLVASPRPDSGLPLLVGMARLLAVEESVRVRRLVVLDAFPTGEADARRMMPPPDLVPRLRADAREDLGRVARQVLAASAIDEARYNALEVAATRWRELERTAAGARAVRVLPYPSIPARSAVRADTPRPAISGSALVRALRAARADEERYGDRLRSVQGYDLIWRNCVTEIFRTIAVGLSATVGAPTTPGIAPPTGLAAAAPAPPDAPSRPAGTWTRRAAIAVSARFEGHAGGYPAADDRLGRAATAASVRRLGGYVDPDGLTTFVPRLSFAMVERVYRPGATRELPSYRRMRLDEMYAVEPSLLVYLRESNTLTARTYRWPADASAFLFFTDDVRLPRPLYGVLNLLTGLGQSVFGLALLPADHGASLAAGLSGALFSLPEMAFVSLRKGTLAYGYPSATSRARTPSGSTTGGG